MFFKMVLLMSLASSSQRCSCQGGGLRQPTPPNSGVVVMVGVAPQMANNIPQPAIDKPRNGIDPESADTIDNPKIEKASNSGELMCIRIGRSTGMVKPRRKAPHNPPISEAA